MILPTISLWQPWSAWVMLGHKRIETRLHNRFSSLVGKTVIIHAAAKWDLTAYEQASQFVLNSSILKTNKHEAGLIGTVFVSKNRICTLEDSFGALIDCKNVVRYGLILNNATWFKLIPRRGRQGIWYEDIEL